MLDALEQVSIQAAQLLGVQLSNRGGRVHSLILTKMLIDVCQTLPLKQTDCSVRPKSLPRQTDHQRLKLFGIEFQLRTMPSIWSDESALVQAACRQPDTPTVDLAVFLKGPFNPSAYSAPQRSANNSSSTIRQHRQAIDRKVGARGLAHE